MKKITCKLYFWFSNDSQEVRRFSVDQPSDIDYQGLRDKIAVWQPNRTGSEPSITWTDSAGDVITISSDAEFDEAKEEMQSLVKLDVWMDCASSGEEEKEAAEGSDVHVNVLCDNCDQQISGFRYKCITCIDFDLCSKCESQHMHPEHVMMRIPRPLHHKAYKRWGKCFRRTGAHWEDGREPHGKRHRRQPKSNKRHCTFPETILNMMANLSTALGPQDVFASQPPNQNPTAETSQTQNQDQNQDQAGPSNDANNGTSCPGQNNYGIGFENVLQAIRTVLHGPESEERAAPATAPCGVSEAVADLNGTNEGWAFVNSPDGSVRMDTTSPPPPTPQQKTQDPVLLAGVKELRAMGFDLDDEKLITVMKMAKGNIAHAVDILLQNTYH